MAEGITEMKINKDFYLDDMDLIQGSKVECVANIACPNFTIGKVYRVLVAHDGPFLVDDFGTYCFPSARFKHFKG